jgi:polysaccharide biosynthesis/export protein
MQIMKKLTAVLLSTILLILPIYSEDTGTENEEFLGFGQQPVLVDPNINTTILAKRVLSTTKYKLTPGDTYELVIQLQQSERIPIILPQDYQLEIPYIGTIDVTDMYFDELRNHIITTVKSRLPVEYVDFILTSPALFDVFVFGGVLNPGITTLTPINRVSEAIALAQGIKDGASYRQIHLLRGDDTIICDLSKFVTQADDSQNPILQPGDRIYVPHADILASITGYIKYPDAYELVPGETLLDIINIAGGVNPGTSENEIEVMRLNSDGYPEFFIVTLEEADQFEIEHGDRISLKSATESTHNEGMILLEATVYGQPPSRTEPSVIPTTPIIVSLPYTPGITLLQLLEKFGGPTPLADSENSFVIRADNTRVYVNVQELWTSKELSKDVVIMPGDHIFIPMEKLVVIVGGAVNNPGAIPYQTGGTVADYIMAAGGLDPKRADFDGIYLLDEEFNRTRVSMTEEVEPGSVIAVDENALESSTYKIAKVAIIVAFFSALATLTKTVFEILNEIRN